MEIDLSQLRLSAGTGVIVWVEGQSTTDEWIYTRWFGSLGRDLLFLAKGGWPSVVDAVRSVRDAAPDLRTRCFGIIDRDFEGGAMVFDPRNPDVPASGIVRTPWYTLENYLLSPSCWHNTITDACRGRAPREWATEDAVAARIADAYRALLPVAAYNAMIHDISVAHPERAPGYLSHPRALTATAVGRLRQWGNDVGVEEDLGNAYRHKLDQFQNLPADQWPELVSGKLMLEELHRSFPTAMGAQPKLEHYVTLYLRVCPDPPEDLRVLVETILAVSKGNLSR